MTATQKENVFKRFIGGELSSSEELLEKFDKAIFLQLIEQETLKNNLTSLLNRYADVYGVDTDGYSGKKTAVNNAIYQKYFATTDALSEAIQDVVTAPGSDGSGGGSGSGSSSGKGGSGGGGSFSTSPVMIPSVAVPQVQGAQLSFDDLGEVPWAQEAIEALFARGVINGSAERTFAPSEPINREEFVKMLLLAKNQTPGGDAVAFTDTAEGDWHYPYIAAGVKLGWVKGIEETLFGVGSPLTRQDMAVLIDRAAAPSAEPSQELFADDVAIAGYARDSVYRLRAVGIVNGDEANRFLPEAFATRAEAAKMIYELIRQEG